jgi:hypothetical protein
VILTPDEIATLTGRQRPRAQRGVLEALGVPYKTRPDGSLVVARVAVDIALGVSASAPTSSRPRLHLPEVRRATAKA